MNFNIRRFIKSIKVSKIEMTEIFLERNINLELLEKVIEAVFKGYEFHYSFKENPLRKFSTKKLLQELMKRESNKKTWELLPKFFV